MQTIIPEIVVR